MSVLVIDIGTSGLRAAVVRPDGDVTAMHYRAMPPSSPFPGLVEFDAMAMVTTAIEVATLALAELGVAAVARSTHSVLHSPEAEELEQVNGNIERAEQRLASLSVSN